MSISISNAVSIHHRNLPILPPIQPPQKPSKRDPLRTSQPTRSSSLNLNKSTNSFSRGSECLKSLSASG